MKSKKMAVKAQALNPFHKGVAVKRFFHSAVFAAMAIAMCAGQGPSPVAFPAQAGQVSAAQGRATAAPQRGIFAVELAKSLNSKKVKEGDEVDARIARDIHTADGMTIRHGSKVIGHVTEAKARSNGATESTLGIVFDKIVQPGGGELPIKSIIQAVAPNPNPESDSGGVSYSGLNEATEKNALPMQRGRSVPILNEQSRGVLEIKNLQLGPGGVLISSGKEVKLDSGMQVLLDVTMQ